MAYHPPLSTMVLGCETTISATISNSSRYISSFAVRRDATDYGCDESVLRPIGSNAVPESSEVAVGAQEVGETTIAITGAQFKVIAISKKRQQPTI